MLRTVVVDDHQLFRQGVISAIADCCEVVGEADDVASAVAIIERVRPAVVLLDVHLPSGSGADVIARFDLTADAAPQFLALSVSDAAEDVIGLVLAGARGYVTKRIDAADLCEALRQVAAGNAVFSPKLAGYVLDAFRSTSSGADAGGGGETGDDELSDDEAAAVDTLTRREREVMEHLARGYTYKEIAAELYISDRTVESHASAVLRKLQLSNRHELAHWATRNRLV